MKHRNLKALFVIVGCSILIGVGCRNRFVDRFGGDVAPVSQPITQKAPIKAPPPPSNTTIFKDTNRGVQFSFLNQLEVLPKSDPNEVVTLNYPTSFSTGTNLVYAHIVFMAPLVTSDVKCLVDQFTGAPLTEKIVQDGVEFFTWAGTEGAAGHTGRYISYQTQRGNLCYNFQLQLYASNLGAFDPKNKPLEFDATTIVAIFQEVFKTLKFTK